ncbi:MAG: hypothetical protein U0842_14980 [Candidatus Binatia bacterium]
MACAAFVDLGMEAVRIHDGGTTDTSIDVGGLDALCDGSVRTSALQAQLEALLATRLPAVQRKRLAGRARRARRPRTDSGGLKR